MPLEFHWTTGSMLSILPLGIIAISCIGGALYINTVDRGVAVSAPNKVLNHDDYTLSTNDTKYSVILDKYRPEMSVYENLYQDIHEDPELSGVESHTAAVIASHLSSLGDFVVHSHIGGHGVVGVLRNGPGKTVLIRAELDALPTLEKTDLPYASKKRMVDRYGNERPVMHACGHDMNMISLLTAAETLRAARSEWSGTLIVLFQPDEEETGGAKAMIEDGLYTKVPIPDIMLAQHVTPIKSGLVAIKEGPVLMAADSLNVRVSGGPCSGPNPQFCEDPIFMANQIISRVPKRVESALRADEVATVACWAVHAGIPGADFVYDADILFDIKTWDSKVREKVVPLVIKLIKAECKRMNAPISPQITVSERAPLTTNSALLVAQLRPALAAHFGPELIEMETTVATEDFSALQGPYNIPYVYWNFGGTPDTTAPSDAPANHSPFFAPKIQPTLRTGADAMAIGVLSFLT